MTANMQIKGNAATPALREKLRFLIKNESSYPISENLIERLIGIMRCYHLEGDAETERTSYFALPGTVCISYHSYLRGEPSPNTYEACCPSSLLKVCKTDFSSLISLSPEFARWCLGNVQNQMYFFEMKSRVVQGSAKERYEAILKKRPEIIQKVPLRIIASYLGITPQYLSKLRRSIH